MIKKKVFAFISMTLVGVFILANSIFAIAAITDADKIANVSKVVFQATYTDGTVYPQEVISNYTFNTSQVYTSVGQSASLIPGRVVFNPLIIVKPITENTPLYFLAEASGKIFKNITVSVYSKVNGTDILTCKYTFQTAGISNIVDTLDVDKNSPTYGLFVEKISFQYGIASIEYHKLNSTGSNSTLISSGWNALTSSQSK